MTTLGIMTAICMAFGVVTASAETLDTKNISIDYDAQKIYVELTTTPTAPPEETSALSDDSTADREILFGVSSTPNSTKKFKTSSWEVYELDENKQAIIDISSLNTQKDNYMQIKGDVSEDPITIHIPATDKKVKLKYDAVEKKVKFTGGEDASKHDINLQYRTQYGTYWENYTNDDGEAADLSIYQQRGATLYFRLKPEAQGEDGAFRSLEDGTEEATELVDITDSKEGEKTKAIKMPAFPGKEIKVAVSKMANGPKAAVDYVKNTVKIPNKAQYRIITSADAAVKDIAFSAAQTAATPLGEADLTKLLEGGILELRTAATDKKPASKITHVSFNAQDETEVAAVAGDDADEDVTKNKVDGAVTAELTSTTKGTTTKYTLKLASTTDDKYEVILNESTTAGPKVADKTGRKTLTKKGLSLANVANGKAVWIHKVGDKKNSNWGTEYVCMGKIVYPAASGGDTGDDDDKDTVTETDLDALAAQLIVENNTATSPVKGESVGDYLTIFKSDATVTLGAEAEYTLTSSSKTISGVKAEIVFDTSIDTDDQAAFDFLEIDAKGLKVKGLPDDGNNKKGIVQLNLTAGKISKSYPIYVRVVAP